MIYVCTCMCVWMYSLVKCECFEHHNRKRPSASSQVIKQHFTYSTRIAYFPIVQRKQYLDIVVFPQKAAFLNSCTSVTELTNIQCEQLPQYMHWYMLLFFTWLFVHVRENLQNDIMRKSCIGEMLSNIKICNFSPFENPNAVHFIENITYRNSIK